MKDSTVITVVAMISITALEAIALGIKNIDGAILSSIVGVLAGMAGYHINNMRK